MSENAARAALDKVGISVSTTRTTFDDAVEGGSVIGTDPAVGSSVNAGTSVVLLISDSVKVPSLIGRSVSSAREELGRLGLEITVRQLTQNDRLGHHQPERQERPRCQGHRHQRRRNSLTVRFGLI